MQLSINEDQPDHYLDVAWKKDEHHARLVADMQTRIFHIYGTKDNGDGKLDCVSSSVRNMLELTMHCFWKGGGVGGVTPTVLLHTKCPGHDHLALAHRQSQNRRLSARLSCVHSPVVWGGIEALQHICFFAID